MNQFLQNINSGDTFTQNNALSNSSTQNVLVDQFSRAGVFRQRPIELAFNDQAKLHGYNPDLALRFVFYLRMITRTTMDYRGVKTATIQKGQGVRDESFKRLLWYAVNEPELFYKHIGLLPIVGSWKDIWQILFIAHQNNIEINTSKIFDIISSRIVNDNLILKYLPRLRSNKKCTTEWSKFTNLKAKELCKFLELSEKDYRRLKSRGTAHEFQRVICSKDFDQLNFDHIPGKALLNLVKGKYLTNHNLGGKYESWLDTLHIAKFNGYPYELGRLVRYNLPLYQKKTIDKQFNNLVEIGKQSTEDKGILGSRRVICAVDRSASMDAIIDGTNTTAMRIGESLGIYFASLLEGEFHNYIIRFSHRSEFLKLHSNSFCDNLMNLTFGDMPSNTDFQSIIDAIVRVRQQKPQIPEAEFPNTLICVSDMEFDPPTPESYEPHCTSTNYNTAIKKLSQVFSPEWCNDFVFIWWDVAGTAKHVPQTVNEPGGYVVSGFDGSIITTLLGGMVKIKDNGEKPDMLEIVKMALDQEILNLIKC